MLSLSLLLLLAQDLPGGPGKAIFQRMCTPCHGIENVVRLLNTRDRWGSIVDDMVSRGATGTDDEVDQVIDYLAANFGRKTNVNTASAADLASGLGITARDADAIVAYRSANGKFQTLQDLLKVPNIDTKKIESSRDKVDF